MDTVQIMAGVAIVAGLAVLLLFILVGLHTRKTSYSLNILQSQLASNQLYIEQLQHKMDELEVDCQRDIASAKKIALENEQVTKQLEHRIKVLQGQLKQTETLIGHIQQQQPEDKLYSRASKLVALGADIAEVMRECDIPQAEAEMLISIHRNRLKN